LKIKSPMGDGSASNFNGRHRFRDNNGKSTYMLARIMPWECFEWNEPLQIASAHRLVTSLEQFRQPLSQMIEENADLGQSGQAHPLATWSRGNSIA
jgi:hypothetical protein